MPVRTDDSLIKLKLSLVGYIFLARGKPYLFIVIDTSISMSIKEIEEIARQLNNISDLAKITIVECDVRIHRIYPFNNRLNNITGKGGTDLRPVFHPDFFRDYRLDGIIYFDDGGGHYCRGDPGVKTLRILTKSWKFTCPWGNLAYFDREVI